jgi:DNA-binding HxlR family transcriptional regulator
MSPSPETRRSCCPVACTLDLIGDRWTMLVIRDLFRGVTRYRDFQRSPEGIATNILASRLAMLTEHEIVEKFEGSSTKWKEYRLTERGKSLGPVLLEIARWGLAHIEGTEAKLAPPGMR